MAEKPRVTKDVSSPGAANASFPGIDHFNLDFLTVKGEYDNFG